MPRTVTIRGLDVLGRRLDALPVAVESGVRTAIREEAPAIAQDMRRIAPRDTGALVNGIQSEVDLGNLEGRAVSTAEHTRYVVYGTSDTQAQDFMTPAAERARRRFPRRVRNQVLEDLRRITE